MRSVIRSEKVPKPIGPYSQGINTGNLVFTSSQVPIDPATGKLVKGGIKEQTRRVMDNLTALLESAGIGFENVVKATVFLEDINSFGQVNEVYSEYFLSDPPARSAFQVAGLPLGAMVEIEMVALVE